MRRTDGRPNFFAPAPSAPAGAQARPEAVRRRAALRFRWMRGAVLAWFGLASSAGCALNESRMPDDGEGAGVGGAAGRSTLQEETGLRPATDPVPGTKSGQFEDARGNRILFNADPRSFKPDAEGEAQLRRRVDEAFDLIMRDQPAEAVERLTEAQTIRGWAQSGYAASILYWLGQAHERLDEPAAAIAAYRKVLSLYPNSPWRRRANKRITALEPEISAIID